MVKLIASDMDGTLLNSEHTISKGNLEAIKFAQEKGVHFAIVTGRDYLGIKEFVDDFNLKCEFVLMNGSQYRDSEGNIIESIMIDNYLLKNIIEIITKNNLSIELFTNKGAFVINKEVYEASLVDRAKLFSSFSTMEEIEEFIKMMQKRMNIKYVEDIKQFLSNDLEVYKIVTFDTDTYLISNVKEALNKISGLAVASTFSNDIEITNIEAEKGKMLSKVSKKLGIEKSEVIVLGDSFNDYSMFKEFENSYAMKNAVKAIKEIAKYETDSNDDDGVAKAIYKALNVSK